LLSLGSIVLFEKQLYMGFEMDVGGMDLRNKGIYLPFWVEGWKLIILIIIKVGMLCFYEENNK
jgi:hypothetical protein